MIQKLCKHMPPCRFLITIALLSWSDKFPTNKLVQPVWQRVINMSVSWFSDAHIFLELDRSSPVVALTTRLCLLFSQKKPVQLSVIWTVIKLQYSKIVSITKYIQLYDTKVYIYGGHTRESKFIVTRALLSPPLPRSFQNRRRCPPTIFNNPPSISFPGL